MPYFSKLDENNIVIDVIFDTEENITNGTHGDPSRIIETDPHISGGYKLLRRTPYDLERDFNNPAAQKNFGQIGCKYHPEEGFFSTPQDYPSWQLDLESGWYLPPVDPPEGVTPIDWDEDNQRWILPDEI